MEGRGWGTGDGPCGEVDLRRRVLDRDSGYLR